MSTVALFFLRGAYLRVADDATAFGGSRSARGALTVAATAPTAELLQADRAWVRTFWDALLPFASRSSGSYVNFMTEYDEDRVRASYGAPKYEPGNVFHLNMNIKPSQPRACRGIPSGPPPR